MLSVYEYLKPSIPSDHCHQSRAIDLASKEIQKRVPEVIVDLGCGTGSSAAFFRRRAPGVPWVGVDIEASPEVSQRTRTDLKFITFDGINLPFEDASVDFIYSNQTLEHVRYPEALLRDVRRVLTKEGVFVGQTSQLEPYHSYSYWNFTVFGFKRICEDAGLKVIELRPGIDANTLFRRSFLGRPPQFSRRYICLTAGN